MGIGNINIAFCFNDESQAKLLAAKMSEISPEINFIIAPTFDGFLKAIGKVEKVDFFVIEESFKECVTSDLIEKLKASQRYKKSLISVFTANLRTLDAKYLTYKLDYVFDPKTSIHDLMEGLEKAIIKSQTPAIPKHFNILAVDDESDILEIISMNVNQLGHSNINLCASVADAKKVLLEKDFDLILLDWNIGDGTCIDIMDFIKNNSVSTRTKTALTVVITARDSVEDIMALLSYGVKDTIIKPFDFREFEDKISYAIEKHLKRS